MKTTEISPAARGARTRRRRPQTATTNHLAFNDESRQAGRRRRRMAAATTATPRRAGAISMGLHLSVMCADYLPFTTRAMIEAKSMAIAPELRSAMLRTGLGYIDNCQVWNVQPSPASVFQAVTSPVPSLVLAGSMDPGGPVC